jgi:hypothetical protein
LGMVFFGGRARGDAAHHIARRVEGADGGAKDEGAAQVVPVVRGEQRGDRLVRLALGHVPAGARELRRGQAVGRRERHRERVDGRANGRTLRREVRVRMLGRRAQQAAHLSLRGQRESRNASGDEVIVQLDCGSQWVGNQLGVLHNNGGFLQRRGRRKGGRR